MSSNNAMQKSISKNSKRFSNDEQAAMKARAKELKAEERANKDKAEGEEAARTAINEMQEPDRSLAKRFHAVIKDNAPDLLPKTWYGMLAYAKDGKVLCYFRPAEKFKERYATFGFNDSASLDEGAMWAVTFALKELTPAVETRIAALIKKALG